MRPPHPFPRYLGRWGASTWLGRQASTCLAWGASLPRIFPREIHTAMPPPPRGNPRAPPPLPLPLYIVEGWEGSRTSSLAQPSLLQYLLFLRRAWRSPAGELQAPPPRHYAAGALPQLLLSPCWIKKEETSPGCTCVERGGAVRSALDRIFRDLNRREHDSINRVLVTLPLSGLQGYEDALPLSLVASLSID